MPWIENLAVVIDIKLCDVQGIDVLDLTAHFWPALFGLRERSIHLAFYLVLCLAIWCPIKREPFIA
jgi:hypothetical protein